MDLGVVIKILEKCGFVEHIKFFRKGFTMVILKENNVYIGHDISSYPIMTLVEEPENNLKEFIAYFNRI